MSVQIVFNFPTAQEAQLEVIRMAKMFAAPEIQSQQAAKVDLAAAKAALNAEAEAKKEEMKANAAKPGRPPKAQKAEAPTPPAQTPKVEEPKAAEPVEETTPLVTKDDAMKAMQTLNGNKGLSAVVKVLKSFNSSKFSDIQEADYPAFVAACRDA